MNANNTLTNVGSYGDSTGGTVTSIQFSPSDNHLIIGRDTSSYNTQVFGLAYTNGGNTVTPTLKQQYMIDQRNVYGTIIDSARQTNMVLISRTAGVPYTSTIRSCTFNDTTGVITSGAILYTGATILFKGLDFAPSGNKFFVSNNLLHFFYKWNGTAYVQYKTIPTTYGQALKVAWINDTLLYTSHSWEGKFYVQLISVTDYDAYVVKSFEVLQGNGTSWDCGISVGSIIPPII